MGKIKLRVKHVGYVMTVNITIMKLQVSLKVVVQLFIIDPNDLRLAGFTKGGVVNTATEFKAILKKLNF